MYRVFEGPNGFYVAWENNDGFHHQPTDGGSRLGWNWTAAIRELHYRRREEEDHRHKAVRSESHHWPGCIVRVEVCVCGASRVTERGENQWHPTTDWYAPEAGQTLGGAPHEEE